MLLSLNNILFKKIKNNNNNNNNFLLFNFYQFIYQSAFNVLSTISNLFKKSKRILKSLYS